ncbi:MetQ/NlpA family ABC transporter substrate-binding protein [Salinibacterium sp. G-O1]|uniref:MetQ/NlpA family ABC transporter substrate-binding protein n=1 Tax=Salinibacterium sp. G-O1 TaxID=3046208 RepID=UPI0024BA9A77|nr:MetQ/NlpA family ABC transporter substrate-binding protein [Salinibacterium sp. G-O1]MDJ0335479.1 MetQ/NlpA family ABC transporter substrate-binding protein [Salinibacterium sp. G-O1]
MRFTFPRRARLAIAASAAVVALGLSGCASTPAADSTAAADGSLGVITVGALATPAGDILKFVQDNLAADAGLEIVFQEFTDYNTPNIGLSDGSIDANLFQNATFLANYNDSTGSDLISIGEAYLPSAAFYSDKVTSLSDLKSGAKIAVPNDPTNEGRALGLLADEGLISIADGATTLNDITDNPKKFEFVEIENATLPQALPDVDAAFVTISFALPAGLTSDQAILIEGDSSPYFNILATRPELKGDARIQKLYELLTSPEVAQFEQDTWGGLVVPVS